ncbi:MAG: hypothetical protein ACYS47_21040 [Planctomycetota bacterium]
MKSMILSILGLMAAVLGAETAAGADQPVELGTLRWLRDFDVAQARARDLEKPILLLFSEVPG